MQCTAIPLHRCEHDLAIVLELIGRMIQRATTPLFARDAIYGGALRRGLVLNAHACGDVVAVVCLPVEDAKQLELWAVVASNPVLALQEAGSVNPRIFRTTVIGMCSTRTSLLRSSITPRHVLALVVKQYL